LHKRINPQRLNKLIYFLEFWRVWQTFDQYYKATTCWR